MQVGSEFEYPECVFGRTLRFTFWSLTHAQSSNCRKKHVRNGTSKKLAINSHPLFSLSRSFVSVTKNAFSYSLAPVSAVESVRVRAMTTVTSREAPWLAMACSDGQVHVREATLSTHEQVRTGWCECMNAFLCVCVCVCVCLHGGALTGSNLTGSAPDLRWAPWPC